MTRKDYVLLAKAITDTQERIKDDIIARWNDQASPVLKAQLDQQLRGVRRTAAHICNALAADNPRFDPGQFLSACGYGATTMNPRGPALDLRPLPEVEVEGKAVEAAIHDHDETNAQCERERNHS